MIEWDTLMPHIVHDVRALARKGVISSQLLQRKLGGDVDSEVAAWLNAIVSAQTDLDLLMRRLSTLLQAGKPQSSSEDPLDLQTMLLGAKLRCRDSLQQCHAEFSIGPLPDCRVPTRLDLAWTELIDNSCRFRDSSRPLQIRIDANWTQDAASLNQHTLCVHYEDNSSGWNPAFSEILFEPLQRLSPEKGGLGLGLAIARTAVESMQGQIRAELGSPGAAFYVLIPVEPNA